jgi:hypothetical protein
MTFTYENRDSSIKLDVSKPMRSKSDKEPIKEKYVGKMVGSLLLFRLDDGRYITCDPVYIENIPEKQTREVWMNIYPDAQLSYANRDNADCNANASRIACVKVTIEFEEGEGL